MVFELYRGEDEKLALATGFTQGVRVRMVCDLHPQKVTLTQYK
jgi:hypothetical protein